MRRLLDALVLTAVAATVLIAATPLPIFKGPQDVSNLIGYLNTIVFQINSGDFPIPIGVGPFGAMVNGTAELKTFPSTTGTYLIRNDFSGGVGAPPLTYKSSSSPCSLNAGNGDDGWQIKASNGGCWLAQFPTNGVDIRQYGATSGSDVTTIFQNIDSAFADGTWPSGVRKSILLPSGSFTLAAATITNAVEIKGAGDYGNTSTITPSNTQLTSGQAIKYIGSGPFTLSDILFTCRTYATTGAFVEPSVCGNEHILVQPPAGAQVTEFRTRNISIVGGNIGMRVMQTDKADIEIDEISTTFSQGIVVSDQTNAAGVFTGRVRIHLKRCILTGQYCVSTPVNVPQGGIAMLAPHDLDIKIDSCIGAGFISLKACLDMTGDAAEQMRFDVTAMNVNIGVETKADDVNFSGTIPASFRDRSGKLVMFQNMDAPSNNCFQVPYANTSAAPNPDLTLNQTYDITCDWSPPATRIDSFPYHAGDVFTTAANHTYQVISDGVSGIGDPTGTTTNTGIQDGTAIISFRTNTLTASAATVGVLLNANSYIDITLHAHNIAFGYEVIPIGSSDNTLRYATLRFSGQVQHQCLFDSYSNSGFGTNLTADNVTLSGWDCTSLTSNQEGIEIGHTSGGNAVNWTNLKIVGSAIRGGATSAGGLRNLGGTVSGDIVGSRIVGGVAAITTAGSTALNIVGGVLGDVAGSSATSGVIHSVAGSSGTITLNQTVIENSDPTIGTWNNTAGTLAVVGTAMNPPSAASPTAHCTAGLDFASGTVPATAYLWGCSSLNTWSKLY